MDDQFAHGLKRIVISAKLSEEAADGWKSFCRMNGVSLSAMLEVAGRALIHETAPPTLPERRSMVDEARRIDIQRRARS